MQILLWVVVQSSPVQSHPCLHGQPNPAAGEKFFRCEFSVDGLGMMMTRYVAQLGQIFPQQMWSIVKHLEMILFKDDDDLVWSPFWETSWTCDGYQRWYSPFNLSTSLPAKQCLFYTKRLVFFCFCIFHCCTTTSNKGLFVHRFVNQDISSGAPKAAKRCEAKTGNGKPDESGVVPRGVSSKGGRCVFCCLCGAPVVTYCEVINFDLYWFSLR